MGLLPQEPPDPDDRGRAHPRPVVDLTIGKVMLVEQAGDVPAFRERSHFGRRAEVGQQPPHLLAAIRRPQRLAQIVVQLQQGRISTYLIYSLVTLLVLLGFAL